MCETPLRRITQEFLIMLSKPHIKIYQYNTLRESMVGILEKKSLQSPSRLSNAFSKMRPKIIDTRAIKISFEWRIIFHMKSLL
jgi:hypothetical protein